MDVNNNKVDMNKMSNNNFLELENIDKTFPLPGGKEYKAVVDVNVKIAKNETDFLKLYYKVFLCLFLILSQNHEFCMLHGFQSLDGY